MSNWAVGHNMPGYMPETDVYVTSDWTSARDALIADLERANSEDWDAYDADDSAEVAFTGDEYADAITELKKLPDGQEYDATIGNTAWWIMATDEEPDDDE